jgi:LacI family transcriptional regulator
MGSVTIKDIAQLAHVSHTTVSRALNGSPLVNEETRQKIRLLAESMNYVPNLSAKGLVRVRSYNIGVFFTSLVHATSSDFIYTVIQSVSDCISGSYNVLFNGIDKLADDYRITTANYDGVLLVSQRPEDDVWIQRIQAAGVPLVVINRKLDDKGIKNIYCDEKAGVQQAVAYLIENGHRDIAYLKGNEESSSTHRRYAGFVDEMEKHHVDIRPEWILSGDYSAESGYRGMQALLKRAQKPTAVISASDAVAFGAMRAAHEAGIDIPGDLSLVGFDDGMLAAYSYPPLTSIRRPIGEMAAEGARQLLRLIEGESWPENTVSCTPFHKKIDPSTERNRTEITIVLASKKHTPSQNERMRFSKGELGHPPFLIIAQIMRVRQVAATGDAFLVIFCII